MELLQITKKDFQSFLGELLQKKNEEVVGVVKKGKHFAFDYLENISDLCLDYDETILPPKKYFLPVQEVILNYVPKDATSYKEVFEHKNLLIVGIHPGDLAAIALLDQAFSQGEADQHYLLRRSNTILIGMYPTTAYPYRFTNSMIEQDAYKAADLFLVDIGDNSYGIEVVSEKGTDFVKRMKVSHPSNDLKEKIEASKKHITESVQIPVARKDLPEFLKNKENHPEWKNRAERCFSCGSCVLVCPTCYCFDVQDDVELSLAKGERKRSWDGCMLEKFANVAGNHNFRKLASDRLKHRIYRKGKYIQEKFNLAGCVGCGRCAQACVAKIASPVEIIEALKK